MPKGIDAVISAKDEREIIKLYLEGDSARSISKRFGIGHGKLRSILAKHDFNTRDQKTAGELRREEGIIQPLVTERDPKKSLRKQVAEALKAAGIDVPRGSREFDAHYARECRRWNPEVYREQENRRQKHRNRIPAWEKKKRIVAFYEMASDLGMHVDHIIPLQGENICGLNVMSNLRLVAAPVNWSKQNKFTCGPDPLIGPPDTNLLRGSNRGSILRLCA